MVKIRFILIVGLSLAAGAVAFAWFFQGDAARIKRQLAALAESIDKSEPESEIGAGIAARRISGMFAPSCRIEAPDRNISRTFTPDDVAAYVMGIRRQYVRIETDFFDIDVDVSGENEAAVSFTAAITGNMSGTETAKDIQEIACRMKKIERDWVFYEIDVVPVLMR